MTAEEKSILVQDLCARLPYGVKVNCDREIAVLECLSVPRGASNNKFLQINNSSSVEYVKPYLFPMSSMIEEQKKELRNDLVIHNNPIIESVDWLYAHHFDVHGLIDKGLAIDATNLNIY